MDTGNLVQCIPGRGGGKAGIRPGLYAGADTLDGPVERSGNAAEPVVMRGVHPVE